MSNDRKSNKNSATEDELGVVHGLVTKLHSARVTRMLELIAQGADPEDVIGDGKALQAAGKWVDSNNITAAQPEMDEETELAKRLETIRKEQAGKGARATGTDNVVPFDDGED